MEKVATTAPAQLGRVILHLGAATIASGCAVGLLVLLGPYVEGASFLLPFAAVCLSAWLGGMLGGTVALTLSAGLLLLFVLPPWREFIRQPVEFVPMVCFLAGS